MERVPTPRVVVWLGLLLAAAVSSQLAAQAPPEAASQVTEAAWQGSVSLAILVRDETGQPLPGTLLQLRMTEGAAPGEGPPTLQTDAEGRLELENLAVGEWQADLRREGFMLYTAHIKLEAGRDPKVGFTSRQRTGTYWAPMEVSFFQVGSRAPILAGETVTNKQANKLQRQAEKDARKAAEQQAKLEDRDRRRAERGDMARLVEQPAPVPAAPVRTEPPPPVAVAAVAEVAPEHDPGTSPETAAAEEVEEVAQATPLPAAAEPVEEPVPPEAVSTPPEPESVRRAEVEPPPSPAPSTEPVIVEEVPVASEEPMVVASRSDAELPTKTEPAPVRAPPPAPAPERVEEAPDVVAPVEETPTNAEQAPARPREDSEPVTGARAAPTTATEPTVVPEAVAAPAPEPEMAVAEAAPVPTADVVEPPPAVPDRTPPPPPTEPESVAERPAIEAPVVEAVESPPPSPVDSADRADDALVSAAEDADETELTAIVVAAAEPEPVSVSPTEPLPTAAPISEESTTTVADVAPAPAKPPAAAPAAPPVPPPAPDPKPVPDRQVGFANPRRFVRPSERQEATAATVPATAAAATPADSPSSPPAAAPRLLPNPELRRAGACPECKADEWSVATEWRALPRGPGAAGFCRSDIASRMNEAIQLIVAGLHPSATVFVGAVISEDGNDVLRLLDEGTRSRIDELLAPIVDPDAACQVVGIVLPQGAQYVGFRYQATDSRATGECPPGAECQLLQARWTATPLIRRSATITVVYGIFQNRSADREREPRLTVYFDPPEGWLPAN